MVTQRGADAWLTGGQRAASALTLRGEWDAAALETFWVAWLSGGTWIRSDRQIMKKISSNNVIRHKKRRRRSRSTLHDCPCPKRQDAFPWIHGLHRPSSLPSRRPRRLQKLVRRWVPESLALTCVNGERLCVVFCVAGCSRSLVPTSSRRTFVQEPSRSRSRARRTDSLETGGRSTARKT